MNRTLLPIAATYGVSSLLLIDSAIKGGLILLVAALAAMLLQRDSAATRHLVWLVAIVAVLVVPVFATLLPQWRALPAWAAITREPPARAPAPDHGPSAPLFATGERTPAPASWDAPPAAPGGPRPAGGSRLRARRSRRLHPSRRTPRRPWRQRRRGRPGRPRRLGCLGIGAGPCRSSGRSDVAR